MSDDSGPMAGILESALKASRGESPLKYYGVVACDFHLEDSDCKICVRVDDGLFVLQLF